MTKNLWIAFAIFAVTFALPFRYAVLEVEWDHHGLSTFGVLFSGIGILAGCFFLLKDETKKEHGHGHDDHGGHH